MLYEADFARWLDDTVALLRAQAHASGCPYRLDQVLNPEFLPNSSSPESAP